MNEFERDYWAETAADEILGERRRQIDKEGYTGPHDDEHADGELERAAMCYLLAEDENAPIDPTWPWAPEDWKPRSRRENILRGAALRFAESDRLERAVRRYNAECDIAINRMPTN